MCDSSGYEGLFENLANIGCNLERFPIGAIQDVVNQKDVVLLIGSESDLNGALPWQYSEEGDGFFMYRSFILGGYFNNWSALIDHIAYLRQPIKFTKVFTFMDSKNLGNLTRSVKFKDAELQIDSSGGLQVTSTKVEVVNNIQKHLKNNFKSKLTNVEYFDDLHDKLFACGKVNIREAIHKIEQCFDSYGPDNVFISFNGGKDCTVLLHLMLAVLKRNYIEYNTPVLCMYVKSKMPFDEIDKFIADMQEFYGLEVITIDSCIKEALTNILNERPNLKACLMGTRRTDPFSQNLQHFKMTDNGWPEVMRVSPLLDWDYGEVWDYLLDFKVPYCGLYDQGYTSLGNVDNSDRNPDLYYNGSYLPAYKLLDGSKERSGRRK